MDEKGILGLKGTLRAGVDGSKQFACRKCGELVWLAPSGQRMLAQGYFAICIDCLPKTATLNPGIIPPGGEAELTPEAKQTLHEITTPVHIIQRGELVRIHNKWNPEPAVAFVALSSGASGSIMLLFREPTCIHDSNGGMTVTRGLPLSLDYTEARATDILSGDEWEIDIIRESN